MRTYEWAEVAKVLNAEQHRFVSWMRPGAVIRITLDKPREIPRGTPAWYLPDSGDIYIYAPDIFDVDSITPSHMAGIVSDAVRMLGQYKSPIEELTSVKKYSADHIVAAATIAGMVQHEAAHSAWTRWLATARPQLMEFKPEIVSTIMTFEELRIEGRVADTICVAAGHGYGLEDPLPKVGRYGQLGDAISGLRASFSWLMRNQTADFFEGAAPRDLANAWALTYGRYIAGVADLDEVTTIHSATQSALTEEVVDELEEILNEAIDVPINDVERLVNTLKRLAERWLELVGSEGSNEMYIEDLPAMPGGRGEGEDGDEEGGGTGAPAGGDGEDAEDTEDTTIKKMTVEGDRARHATKEDQDAVDEANKEHGAPTQNSGHEETSRGHGLSADGDPQFLDESAEIIRKAVEEMAGEMIVPPPPGQIKIADAKKISSAMLNDKSPRDTYSWKTERPKASDRRNVTKVARALELLAIPSVTKSSAKLVLPPGRLDTRGAVKAAADRSMGRPTDARPWKHKKRKHEAVRPTVVGVMTDVSGSMGWAERYVAEFTYAFNNAGHRISARTASVIFGSHAEISARPGELLNELRIRSAHDGMEEFNQGAAALDGMLRLTEDKNAVRLVMIVSDGELVGHMQPQRAAKWIEQWTNAGVNVVWVAMDDHSTAMRYIQKNPRFVNTAMHAHGDEMIDTAIAKIREISRN